ncbi:MAG: Hsp33 family molecular chaperone HslO [Chthoniobacterales bacterium]
MSEEIGDDRNIEVRTYFVRGRNALVARADFSKVFVDYYLHIAEFGLQVPPHEAEYAKSALAAVTLHCASRPRNERIAWTVNFQLPLLNVFAAGDNPLGTVVANVFSEGVRVRDANLFYADTIRGSDAPLRSVVDFEGSDFFAAAERFYEHSEQRLARFFHHHDDDYVLVSAQPDCDLEWLAGLDADAVRQLDKTEELALLEQRYYRFECGCNQQRMMRVLLPTFQKDPEALYEGAEVIRMSCPRCGARHAITRESLEALQKSEATVG